MANHPLFLAKPTKGASNPASVRGNGSHDFADPQPWTAARCQRLLRQLECRLSTLRRSLHDSSTKQNAAMPAKRPSPQDWECKVPKNRRQTYSSRKQTVNTKIETVILQKPARSVRTFGTFKLDHKATVDDNAGFPSPMTKTCQGRHNSKDGKTLAEELAVKPGINSFSVPSELAEQLDSLRCMTPCNQYHIYESLFSWLSRLLRITTSRAHRSGPKTLLAMCLRKVPACMDDIEAYQRDFSGRNPPHTVHSSPPSSVELYEQLELLDPSNLALVLRSDVLHVLSKESSNGLFSSAQMGLLLRLCLHYDCDDGAISLAAAFTASTRTPLSSQPQTMLAQTADSKLQPLNVLLEATTDGHLHGLIIDHFRHTLRRNSFSQVNTSDQAFATILATALNAVATSDGSPPAIDFVCMALKTLTLRGVDGELCVLQRGDTCKRLISLAAGLVVAVSDVHRTNGAVEDKPNDGLQRSVILIFNRAINCFGERPTETERNGLIILVMARYLATMVRQDADARLRAYAAARAEDMMARASPRSQREQREFIIALVCSVAHGLCPDHASSSPRKHLLAICDWIVHGLSMPEEFSRGMKKDCAFLWAQRTQNLQDLAIAEALCAGESATSSVLQEWRWEEGISEWVSPSPTIVRRRKATSA